MKQLLRYIFCYILLSACHGSLLAQTPAWKDAKAIFSKYSGQTALSFKANIRLYSNGQPGKLADQQTATYILSQGNYYCRIGNIELLKNKKYRLTVDHGDRKLLIAGKRSGNMDAQEAAFDITGMFSRMKHDSVEMVSKPQGQLRLLEVTGMNPDIRKYSILYDPQTFFAKQIIIDLQQDGHNTGKGYVKLQIDYYQYVTTPPDTAVFSEKKYVNVNGKNAVPQSAYTAYQLINQL
jgi:hypothetical protein